MSAAAPAAVNDNDDEPGRFEFDLALQRKIASLFLRDTNFAMKTKDLLRPEYFTEDAVGAAVAIVQNHVQTYKSTPDAKILVSVLKDAFDAKRVRDDMKDDVKAVFKEALKANLSNNKYALDQVRDFARNQAMQAAIMASLPALQKGDYDTIRKEITRALSVGQIIDGGDYDYFGEIGNRTQRRIDIKAGKMVKRGITTGYSEMDTLLYHMGWGRKELSVIMGAAKAGKSMALGDFTKNAALAGFKTFYGSCEVAAWIIAERVDAAMADTAIRDLHVDPALVKQRIEAAQAKSNGVMRMRDFPSGTLKVSHLANVLEDYRNDGIMFDLITVDYADIMAAEYRNDQLRENLREIYIDLRALGHEYDAALLTATQTNRDGAKASLAKATDVGDDWNKARTADILIGINATDAEKAKGEARLYWALSRNTEDGFTLKINQDRSKMRFISKVLGKI